MRSRRAFVVEGTLVTAGLMFACKARKAASGVAASDVAADAAALNPYLHVDGNGGLVLFLDKLEMGQGVSYCYAAIVAEELFVLPEDIVVRHAPAGEAYANLNVKVPLLGIAVPVPVQITGLSSSTGDGWRKLRLLGAGARELLLQAAARHWGVAVSGCRLRDGQVQFDDGQRHEAMGLGELVRELGGAAPATAARPTLLAVADAYKTLGFDPRGGRPSPRSASRFIRPDAADKCAGKTRYGLDVGTEETGTKDILQATVVHAAEIGATIQAANEAELRAMPGIVDVFPILEGRAVAIVAHRLSQAFAAAAKLSPAVTPGPNAGFNSDDLIPRYQQLMDARVSPLTLGEMIPFNHAWNQAGKHIEAEYITPYAPHSTMEPMNATVTIAGGKALVWAGTQFPAAAQAAVARILNMHKDQVVIQPVMAGGGFGRRLLTDFIVEATVICQHLGGATVKLVWRREEDFAADYFRPMALQRLRAGLDGLQLAAWEHQIGVQSVNEFCAGDYVGALMPAAIKGQGISHALTVAGQAVLANIEIDPFSVEGANDMPYTVKPNVLHLYQLKGADRPNIPITYWRSVGHFHTIFAIESFLDEVAQALGRDPAELRRSYIKDPRLFAVLDRVVAMSNYHAAALPAGQGLGLAMLAGWGSYCALVAHVAVDAETKRITVPHCFVAIDCGFPLQPDMIRAQVESAVVFGLSATLKQDFKIRGGVGSARNFFDCDVIRMHEAPQTQVEIILQRDNVTPTGVGEIPVPLVAPAVCNGIARATGQRHRRLPLGQ